MTNEDEAGDQVEGDRGQPVSVGEAGEQPEGEEQRPDLEQQHRVTADRGERHLIAAQEGECAADPLRRADDHGGVARLDRVIRRR